MADVSTSNVVHNVREGTISQELAKDVFIVDVSLDKKATKGSRRTIGNASGRGCNHC